MSSLPKNLGSTLRTLGFVEVEPGPGLIVDIRYASPDNVFGRAIYGSFDRLFLHPIAAEKLRGAVAGFLRRAAGGSLVVYDGLRPNRIQREMWDAVRGTPQWPYVGDPTIGSIHGFGFAVDLSWCGPDGQVCDMGTAFDSFVPLAEPRHEVAFLSAGLLTQEQVSNRLLLRSVMTDAGFLSIDLEWWHFDALPADLVRSQFTLIE